MDRSDDQQESFLSGQSNEQDDIVVSSENDVGSLDAGEGSLPEYGEKSGNAMRYILLALLAVVGVGFAAFFIAGDQIISMVNGGPKTITPMALQQQKTPSASVNDVAPVVVGTNPMNEAIGTPPGIEGGPEPVVSDGSFTDIEKPANNNEELVSVLDGEQAIVGQAADMIQKAEDIASIKDGLGAPPVVDDVLAVEEKVEEPELPKAPLAAPSQIPEFDQQAILDEVIGDNEMLEPAPSLEMDPDLEDIIAGRNVPKSQSLGGYNSRATTDRVQETITVYPKVKKMILVEKNYASTSDRSLAEAAVRALRAGQYAVAVDHYDALLATDPSNVSAQMGKARALQRMGNKEAALVVYGDVLDSNPSNVNALTNYLGLVGTIDPHMAAQELEALHRNHPSNADIAAQLGIVYGKMKDPVKAAVYFEKASSLDPDNALYAYNMAVLADRMGSTGKAIIYYNKTVDMINDAGGHETISTGVIFKRLAQLRGQ